MPEEERPRLENLPAEEEAGEERRPENLARMDRANDAARLDRSRQREEERERPPGSPPAPVAGEGA